MRTCVAAALVLCVIGCERNSGSGGALPGGFDPIGAPLPGAHSTLSVWCESPVILAHSYLWSFSHDAGHWQIMCHIAASPGWRTNLALSNATMLAFGVTDVVRFDRSAAGDVSVVCLPWYGPVAWVVRLNDDVAVLQFVGRRMVYLLHVGTWLLQPLVEMSPGFAAVLIGRYLHVHGDGFIERLDFETLETGFYLSPYQVNCKVAQAVDHYVLSSEGIVRLSIESTRYDVAQVLSAPGPDSLLAFGGATLYVFAEDRLHRMNV